MASATAPDYRLLTADRKAKPAWYRFNEWTGGDPSIVPRAGADE